MENYEPDYYTEKVIETCHTLKDEVTLTKPSLIWLQPNWPELMQVFLAVALLFCIKRWDIVLSQVMPKFEARLETTVDALAKDPQEDPQENDFIDSSRLVYDGVREIRLITML